MPATTIGASSFMPATTSMHMASSYASLPTSEASPAHPLFAPTAPLMPTTAHDLQVCVRTPRAERVTTSCSECRRRKQKCDQGRPCSNCIKRFPQPACEYKQNKRRNPALTNEPAFKVVLPSHIYDFRTYGGVRGPMFPSSLALQHMQQFQPLSAQSLLVPTPISHPIALPQQSLFPSANLDVSTLQQQQQQPWNMFVATAASESESIDVEGGVQAGLPADSALNFGTRWPQLDIMSLFAAELTELGDTSDGINTTSMPLHMATAASASASPDPIFGMGQPPAMPALHFFPSANSTCGDFAPILDSSVALSLHHQHHEVLNDAFRILRARRAADGDGADGLCAWLRILTWTAPGDRIEAQPLLLSRRTSVGSSRSSGSSYASSMHDADDALATKLIQLFRSSLKDHSGCLFPYMLMFVPCCLELPLLAQVAVYTSASFLHDTGYLEELADGMHKERAAQVLHAQLHPGDESMAGAIQLVMEEWYCGPTTHLHTRLQGLYETIRLRGGVEKLGTSGLLGRLAKTVIYVTAIHSSDMAIALPFETNPMISGTSSRYAHEETTAPFRVAHNSPFLANLPSFSQCAEALQLHATTASILDDVRFLISAVLGLPEKPTPKDQQKIQTTARWIHDRIQKLPLSSSEAAISRGNAKQPDTASARRPSIVLSRAEPMDTQSAAPDTSLQSYFYMPSMLSSTTSHRGDSTSPHLQPLSPCGSADGSITLSAHSNNSDGRSRRGSTRKRRAAPLLAIDADLSLPADPPPDPLYDAVRQTALIYSRAILQQKPLREVVEPDELGQLWDTAWHVSLTGSKGMVGVLMWVALGMVSSARDGPQDRFVKSLLSLCTVQTSLGGWEVALGALRAALRLNVWLARGQHE
ncbi:hypothetical protein F503_03080 [Ophiostoma piceae UAMH 11346]|uniref:Zn(2)-C6 fungal-type domain-containing protein n=1 Tax=Ophiostoma piceae (strain UAMH 11346) TaxID=1262450 RepID=S3CJN2_OPHP1|nr:hypothetical protein F503_03080 [Ophiostoma piceae UAMH 11346]